MKNHYSEIQSGKRFEFGKNWASFLKNLDQDLIQNAESSFLKLLEAQTIKDKSFIDIGCGSGIVSLVAKKLGAQVLSLDYDPNSVICTKKLKEKYFPKDLNWVIKEGSILDKNFIGSLGQFDIVYSWGVLHHTGNMYEAIKNAASLCKEEGTFFISIYNNQGWPSKCWWWVKREYNKANFLKKKIILWLCFLRLWGPSILRDFLRLKPFESYRNYSRERGMKPYTDVLDWVGGFPFEYAKPEDIFNFLKKDFHLVNLKTCGGRHGCNEFIFKRKKNEL